MWSWYLCELNLVLVVLDFLNFVMSSHMLRKASCIVWFRFFFLLLVSLLLLCFDLEVKACRSFLFVGLALYTMTRVVLCILVFSNVKCLLWRTCLYHHSPWCKTVRRGPPLRTELRVAFINVLQWLPILVQCVGQSSRLLARLVIHCS